MIIQNFKNNKVETIEFNEIILLYFVLKKIKIRR